MQKELLKIYLILDFIPIVNENDTIATTEINMAIMIDWHLEWLKLLMLIL